MIPLALPLVLSLSAPGIPMTRTGTIAVPLALKDVNELEIVLNVEPGVSASQVVDLVSRELRKAGIQTKGMERRQLIVWIRFGQSQWNYFDSRDPASQCSVAIEVMGSVAERMDVPRGDDRYVPDAPVVLWSRSWLRMASPMERDAAVLEEVQEMVDDFLDMWRRAQTATLKERPRRQEAGKASPPN